MKYVDKKEKAAATARAISRLLRKAGFQMADTSDRYKWTPGFYVHRIGLSRWRVAVGYHFADQYKSHSDREHIAKAREFLKSKGYQLDDRGWLEVE